MMTVRCRSGAAVRGVRRDRQATVVTCGELKPHNTRSTGIGHLSINAALVRCEEIL